MTDARTGRLLLLGHRGARSLKSIPENTIASFDQALADGCDGFEFDVRLTADRKAVVCHDPQVQGLEIAQVSAERLPGLPLLQDVLAWYKERAFLDIELKVGGLERVVADLVRQHSLRCGFVVSSFLPEVLLSLHAEDPAIPLGLICETDAELRRWKRLPVEYVMPQLKLASAKLMRELNGAGKKILVWTVNMPGDMRRFADWGVDGVISDDTKLLCRTLKA